MYILKPVPSATNSTHLHLHTRAPAAMKLSAAALFSSCVLASASAVSPASDPRALHSLNARGSCHASSDQVSRQVYGSFTGVAKLKWFISGDALSNKVCQRLVSSGDRPCTRYAPTLESVIAGVIQLQMFKNAPTKGAVSSGLVRRAERDPAGILADHILARGFVWDQIESPGFWRRESDTGDVDQHFVIRGLSHPDRSTIPADVYFTSYADGTGTIRTVHSAGHTELSKRIDAPGFKIIWRTESHSDAADYAISNNRDIVELASRVAHDIASNWSGASDYYGLDQWIGTVGISYIVTSIMGTSLRIIPEVNSFGVEYEDVAVCGSLGTP